MLSVKPWIDLGLIASQPPKAAAAAEKFPSPFEVALTVE